MHVVATAGHVDHGKSTLVRALTGMEPDRFAEERRRGLTIDLGYAWTTLPTGEQLAFVDVPGHQRFIANMLAGLGPAPAVLFVVAADEGWSAQSDEHLAVVNALGIQHGVLAVTRSDRADPAPVLADAVLRLGASSLAGAEAVAVSAVTGLGLDAVRLALSGMLDRVPQPEAGGPVRLWVDRSFTLRGVGTVVTGTLGTGTVAVGSRLALGSHVVTVRGIQTTGNDRTSVGPVSRVALNLRSVAAEDVGRGDVLLSPSSFHLTSTFDARLGVSERLPAELVLHVGTAAVAAHVRPLGPDTARLTLRRELPLRAGDRAVLRDPGRHAVAAGVLVLDADPPDLRRRGAARLRGSELASASIPPDPRVEIARRGAVPRLHLDRLGIDTSDVPDVGGWLVSAEQRARWLGQLPVLVHDWARAHPLEPSAPRAAVRQAMDIPDAVLDSLLAPAGLREAGGRIGATQQEATLGPSEAGLSALLAQLAERPFAAPERGVLDELGLGRREVAAAVRAGRLFEVADGVVLAPDAVTGAAAVLRRLESPFTLSAARVALGTTRRVAVPLLEHLDAIGVTQRVDSTTRCMTERDTNTP